MAVTDLIGAIVAFGRSKAAITALTSTRISGRRQDAWTLPGYAIVADGPKGGPVLEPPLRRARVDLLCYGPDDRTSKLLAETLLSVFVPDDGSVNGFTAASTQILEVSKEAEPFWLPDPDTDWPLTICPLLFLYSGVSV